MTKEQALETLFYQKYFITATWAKLFKRKLFSNVEFPYGKLAEDMGSTYKLIHHSGKVVYGSKIQYYYRLRAGSIIHALSIQKGKDYIEQSEDMVKFIEKNTRSWQGLLIADALVPICRFCQLLPFPKSMMRRKKK